MVKAKLGGQKVLFEDKTGSSEQTERYAGSVLGNSR